MNKLIFYGLCVFAYVVIFCNAGPLDERASNYPKMYFPPRVGRTGDNNLAPLNDPPRFRPGYRVGRGAENSDNYNTGSLNQPKRVVNNQQRLFPLPRVGRGGENAWDYNLGKFAKYSLMAFPRVGRSDLNALSGDVNARSGDPKKMNPNLWFGPRLGRVQKRDIYLYDLPKDYQHDYLYPGSQELRHFNPSLGRDSVEDLEESEE